MAEPDTAAESGAWLHPALVVAVSPIAGRGLFADRDLAAGTVVLRLGLGSGDRVDVLGTGFPNHACEPNVGWADELALATSVDLSAGVELLSDYATSIHDPDWLLRCHCPSYRCRQMVEGSDWRIPQLQRRYAGSWRPSVQRLVDQTTAG